MARILIAAAHKSSGKTTVSLGIARALARRGVAVQSFKKGPDYIDPMWHQRATGRPCFNLDFNTQSATEIAAMLTAREAAAEIALIEGNMGLYDGVDLEGRDGNAALAKLTGTPVILVVDTEGMTRGIAPLLIGYRVFDPEVHVAGVVLNRVANERHEAKLRAAVERYTEVPVIGALPRRADLMLPERHLGLTTPTESDAVESFIDRIADAVAERFDLDTLLGVARLAMPLPSPRPAPSARAKAASDFIAAPTYRPRIAIARDSAFGFYYPDDLEALQAAGADLVFFDALRATALPASDGLFIGGGFPETHMHALAANASLRASIRDAILGGMPAYAECGGLMYLTRAIRWHGTQAEMVGVVPGFAQMHERPQGRGQVILQETAALPWPPPGGNSDEPRTIRAHEFHHAAIVDLPPDLTYAFDVRRGAGLGNGCDGIVIANLVAGFAHLRSTEMHPWAQRFVDFVRQHAATRSADDGNPIHTRSRTPPVGTSARAP
ncbi:MAG: cobyrinate a,c-diamide synthase [Hyphomicrobiaceae bacterium]